MIEKITEPGQTATNPEEEKEKARRSDMAKGTDGASEIGSEYEQGAVGTNKQVNNNNQLTRDTHTHITN